VIVPGPGNRLSDVPGIRVGDAEDHAVRNGVTVVLPERPAAIPDLDYAFSLEPGQHIILCVVATDLPLNRMQARRLAVMAQDGLARALRPVHTPFDGDVVFAPATGEGAPPPPEVVAQAGMLAADCLTRAVARGVVEADTLGAFGEE